MQFWTVFSSVVAGVLIFVAGQFVMKFVLEPVQAYKLAVARLQMIFAREDAGLIGGVEERLKEGRLSCEAASIREELKLATTQMYASASQVLGYRFVRHLFGLPNRKSLDAAMVELRGLRNMLGAKDDEYWRRLTARRRKIFKLLSADDPGIGDREEDEGG